MHGGGVLLAVDSRKTSLANRSGSVGGSLDIQQGGRGRAHTRVTPSVCDRVTPGVLGQCRPVTHKGCVW